METIIGLIGGIVASGAVYFLRKFGLNLVVRKYGKVVKGVFDVLDPIAGNLMSNYNESEVQQAIQLIVTRVADSEIDESDVVEITNYVLAKFDPTLAAAKVLDKESEKGKATLEIVENVAALHDGVSVDEIFAIARSAKALF